MRTTYRIRPATWFSVLLAVVLTHAYGHTQSRIPAPGTSGGVAGVGATVGSCRDLFGAGRFVVIFHEDISAYEYPAEGIVPLEGEELLLCIESPNRWTQYGLTWGPSHQGDTGANGTQTSVGSTSTDTVTTALRATSANVDANVDCASLATIELQERCYQLLLDNDGIFAIQREVEAERDDLAQLMVDASAHALLDQSVSVLASLSNAICPRDPYGHPSGGPERPSIALPVGTLGTDAEPLPSCPHRYTIEDYVNLNLPPHINWVNGQWHFSPAPNIGHRCAAGTPPSCGEDPHCPLCTRLPAHLALLTPRTRVGGGALPANAAITSLETERAALLSILSTNIREYSRLTTMAANVVEAANRRQLVFRLGRFGGNTILQATLTKHDYHVTWSADRDAVNLAPQSQSYSLNLTIHGTSFFRAEAGVVVSTISNPTVTLTAVEGAMGAATMSRVHINDSPAVSAAAFVSLHWCAQDTSVWIYGRRCSGGQNWRRLLPGIAIGVPLGKQLFDLNAFVGVSLPYIPYASLIVGIQVGQVPFLRTGFAEGMLVTETNPANATELRLSAAPFVSLTLNSDLIQALGSVTRPAQ